MKKSLSLLGILCLVVLESQLNMPVFASRSGETGNSQITIEEFVRSVHPHGISVSSAIKYQSLNGDSDHGEICRDLEMPKIKKDAVCKILKMLKEEDEKPFWANIVVTLGLIGDPLAIPGIIGFIENLEKKPNLDYFESRALSHALWALGLAINEGKKTSPPTEGESLLDVASNFLISKSKGENAVIENRQHSATPPPPNHKTVIEDIDIGSVSSIRALAFADTEETKSELEKIRKDADGRYRDWLDHLSQVQENIHNAGSLLCYREPKTLGCK